jgi:hypothetical protein
MRHFDGAMAVNFIHIDRDLSPLAPARTYPERADSHTRDGLICLILYRFSEWNPVSSFRQEFAQVNKSGRAAFR